MKNNLNEQELKNYFAKQDDVEFALIFGSYTLGRINPLSDIDIAVYFRKDEDTLKLGDRQIDITCVVMRLCQINRVDVVVLNVANPFLRYQVIKYGRLIYVKDEKVFYKFKAQTLGIYQDIKPMYDLYDKVAQFNLRYRKI
jgi:hypothetical protein